MWTLAERYYRHWQSKPSADALEQFLIHHPGMSVDQLVQVLLVDQTLQWQNAAGTLVEQYLQRFPAVTDRQSFVLELLYGELRAAQRLSLAVDFNTYVARFPNLAESLRRQIEVSEWLRVSAEDFESENHPPD